MLITCRVNFEYVLYVNLVLFVFYFREYVLFIIFMDEIDFIGFLRLEGGLGGKVIDGV